MVCALYLSNTTATSVTDAQLTELNDFELVLRTGASDSTAAHLDQRSCHIVHAPICAEGTVKIRSNMLCSIFLLHTLLTEADPVLLHIAVRGVIAQSLTNPNTTTATTYHHHLHKAVSSNGDGGGYSNDGEQARALALQDAPFLRPLVSIAVNRV